MFQSVCVYVLKLFRKKLVKNERTDVVKQACNIGVIIGKSIFSGAKLFDDAGGDGSDK